MIEEILTRDCGRIPTNIEGINTYFSTIDDLEDAVPLRWHTRLVASLERGLVDDPEDWEGSGNRSLAPRRADLLGRAAPRGWRPTHRHAGSKGSGTRRKPDADESAPIPHGHSQTSGCW